VHTVTYSRHNDPENRRRSYPCKAWKRLDGNQLSANLYHETLKWHSVITGKYRSRYIGLNFPALHHNWLSQPHFHFHINCRSALSMLVSWSLTSLFSTNMAISETSALSILHLFNSLFSRTTRVHHSGFYWSKRWWRDSGISWIICKSSAPCSRQITMPVHHHSVFTGWMPFLPPNQQRRSTEGKSASSIGTIKYSGCLIYSRSLLKFNQFLFIY